MRGYEAVFWKLSILTSLLAGLATIYILQPGWETQFSFVENLLLMAVPLAFMTGPYLGFGALAFWLRSNFRLSVALFVIVVFSSVLCLGCIAVDQDAWRNNASFEQGQRMLPFVIALGHWFLFLVTAIITLLVFYLSKKDTK